MIPFFFRHYKKAPLATCVSYLSTLGYAGAFLFTIGYVMNWEGMRDELPLAYCLMLAVFSGAVGFGFMKLAAYLAERKYQKLAAKTGASAPVASASAAPVRPVEPARTVPPASGRCPTCGAKTDQGDVFCVHCGAKL